MSINEGKIKELESHLSSVDATLKNSQAELEDAERAYEKLADECIQLRNEKQAFEIRINVLKSSIKDQRPVENSGAPADFKVQHFEVIP